MDPTQVHLPRRFAKEMSRLTRLESLFHLAGHANECQVQRRHTASTNIHQGTLGLGTVEICNPAS